MLLFTLVVLIINDVVHSSLNLLDPSKQRSEVSHCCSILVLFNHVLLRTLVEVSRLVLAIDQVGLARVKH